MRPNHTDARLSGRHPFELLVLFAMLITAIPTVLGVEPTPGSISATLPLWLAYGWACVLAVGCFTALVGVFMRNRGIGLIIEQLGLAPVGIAGIIYSACILVASLLPGALITAGIFFSFGVACLIRWRQLQQILDDAVALDRQRKRNGGFR